MAQISFKSDGYKLAGNLFQPSAKMKNPAFLFIQGWKGHQNVAAAQALTDLGFTTMTYDMRGNGESEGQLADYSRSDFIHDAAVAYDYLKRYIDPETAIGAIGSSFGSYTAVLLSAERPIYCLSLRVPASYPDQGYDQPQLAQKDPDDFMDWRKQRLDYSENHAFQALHNFPGNVQIIEAEADELVPSQAPKNYADAVADKSKLRYEVVTAAPHRLVNQRLQADYERRLVAWANAL